MLRRLRLRRPVAALGAVLLLPALAACGGDSGNDTGNDTGSSEHSAATADTTATPGLSAVTFTGAVGKSLSATWHSTVDAPKATTVTTLVKGTGAKIAAGDTVSAYLYLGDGTTKKDAYSDYTKGSAQPIANNGKLSDVFTQLLADATYGSRVVAVTSASDLFGASGDAQLGVGAGDSLVVVADLVEKAATAPAPTDSAVHDVSPGQQPKVVLTKGEPSGLDWTGVTEPALTTPVQRVILTQGTGPAVQASDTVTVNYLGETYQATSPFDESYTKKPLTSALSGLIQGWSIGLTGVKVGSRVLLEIPPAYGYGAEGSGSAIPGNATLWFVIDVVGVK